MANKFNYGNLTRFGFLIVLVISLNHSVVAGGNGKGGGKGGSDTNPPTTVYQAHPFSLPDPAGTVGPANSYGGVINNRLQVAGSYTASNGDHSAFFYDPAINETDALDLNAVTQGVPSGFVIRAANGINETGIIAVVCVSDPGLRFSDPANEVLSGVVNTSNGFQFYPLPAPPVIYDETNEYAQAISINNSSDVLIVSQQLEAGVLRVRVTWQSSIL